MSQYLTIQRASAGSGKTYTLARQYILLLISIRDENGRRRLRTDPELAESAGHILAVTFTNAATIEMKQRILKRLAELGASDADMETTYMKDYCRQLSATCGQVSAVCRKALAMLLHAYSDFNVSTIDSFFQTILRTFAYEANVNNAYEVELDSDYLARVGLDTTIDEVLGANPPEDVKYWIEYLMRDAAREGRNWNIFRRSDSGKALYGELARLWSVMQKEAFKEREAELDEYFETHDLRDIFGRLQKIFGDAVLQPLQEAKKAARDVEQLCASHGVELDELLMRAGTHVTKTLLAGIGLDNFKYDRAWDKLSDGGSPFAGKYRGNADPAPFREALCRMYSKWHEAVQAAKSPQYRTWELLRLPLVKMGIIHSMKLHAKQYMTENNLVELAETNSLLSRIIGDDDAPFIYERIGTYFNHYLIDEFQDTSTMQWDNMRPLLTESLSHDNENLIIGDAKQSIYRFRNAEPKLITEVVPQEFPDYSSRGDAPEDNTNHRSSERIVRFNNTLFHLLPRCLDERFGYDGVITGLYSNAIQPIYKTDGQGYVRFLYTSQTTDEEGNDTFDSYARTGDLIDTLIAERNYLPRQIAVLVNTHAEGDQVVKALLRHNRLKAQEDPDYRPIEFLSEESLHLSASSAVNMVIAVLELIAKGRHTQLVDDPEHEGHKKKVDPADLGCSFSYFRLNHPDLSHAQALKAFFQTDSDFSAIAAMLEDMQSVALPSLVEAVAQRFIDDNLRKKDAPFLAAFQDELVDYCEKYNSDPASFLQWWHEKGSKKSISSSDDMDAVRIMTIHKAKGLEFDVVIIPLLKISFQSNHSETVWVESPLDLIPGLPPILPADLGTKASEGTPFADLGNEIKMAARAETVNKLYVAFTRAVRELHVFMPPPSKDGTPNVTTILTRNIFPQIAEGTLDGDYLLRIEDLGKPDEEDLLACKEMDPELSPFVVGATLPCTEHPESLPEGNLIPDYYINLSPSILHYREEGRTEEEDMDPRSVGNLLHEIMQEVIVGDDLPGALRRRQLRGVINARTAAWLERILSQAIYADELTADWFSGRYRVLTERPMLIDDKTWRPDRIMIGPDGNAVIVDYKFGDVPDNDSSPHHRQVRRYMEHLLRTGVCRSVEGYLWYMKHSRLIRVLPNKKK